MLIRFRSWSHRPPHRVSCRVPGTEEVPQTYEGTYVDSTWLFRVPGHEPDQFSLVLDGQVRIETHPTVGDVEDVVDVTEATPPPRVPIGVDDGRLQQAWFAEGEDRDLWDVVIVGTGMGGGALAATLAGPPSGAGGRDLDVLVLEAGSLLFPLHASGLPRELYGPDSTLATSLWNTLQQFGTRPYEGDFSNWAGWEIFALGGRTLYWGGLCPRISRDEFARGWPDPVSSSLNDADDGLSYYSRAENLLRVGRAAPNGLEADALGLLADLLPARSSAPSPMALRSPKHSDRRIPGGLFSTAELLLGQRLGNAAGDGSLGKPYIHLAEIVTRVTEAGGGWQVEGTDLRDGTRTRHRARVVVLCAGTEETPRIMAGSGLGPSGAGRGFTEHPMAYLHFQVPPGSPFSRPGAAANLLSLPGPDGDWNLQLELGSDRILDRTVPSGFRSTQTMVDPGCVAGQMVFLGRADRGDGYLEFDHSRPWPDLGLPPGQGLPSITLHQSDPGQPDLASWQQACDEIVSALGARPLPGENATDPPLRLLPSLPGAVSHEIGTMAIGPVVDDDLQVVGCPGLYVCDNSVFPTSPAANPSLTLAALAIRLADHLRR